MPKLFILILLTFLTLPSVVLAEEAPELTLPDTADVRIIVDISGSMKENDPGNLRQPAVRLLARMLPEGSKAGVWTFGQYVNMLIPHGEVTGEWRAAAIKQSGQINSVALRTNLGKAIEVASDDYITGDDLSNTHYILLTDGEVDISDSSERNRQEAARILESLLPKLAAKGARFHPVALSFDADTEFLKQLASESGGRFQVAESAGALSRAFIEALNAAIPQQQIPIKGNTFTVDSGVKEFTALIFYDHNKTDTTGSLELIRPDGKVVSLSTLPATIRWVKETDYNLITVDEPLSGEWRIKGELGEGSRVTVVSDLKMIVSAVPPSFSQDEPISLSIAFFEGEEKITNSDFLQVLNVSLVVTSADGQSGTKVLSGDQSPANGVYNDTIDSLPIGGVFTINVVADGQTFARKFSAVTEFILPEEATGEVSSENSGLVFGQDSATDTMPDVNAEAEPVIENPIDVTLAEQPESEEPVVIEPETTPELASKDESGFSLWIIIAAGVAGLLILILLIWFVLKKRKIEAVIPEEIPEVTDQTEPDENESELEIAVDEADDVADEDIPVADAVVEEDDEFGLEDFDLSESDDLPDDGNEQKT